MSSPRLGVAVAAVCGAALGCTPASAPDAGPGCATPCTPGFLCLAGQCEPRPCAGTGSCPAGLACTEGYCLPEPTGSTGGQGSAGSTGSSEGGSTSGGSPSTGGASGNGASSGSSSGGPDGGAAYPGCIFTGPAAAWITAGFTGAATDISSRTQGWSFPLHANDGWYGEPFQYSDGGVAGAFGDTTCINDFGYWGQKDAFCVPNPLGGQWTVSCGWTPPSSFGQTSCWSAYDGKDFIIDQATGVYYDIDKLYVDAQGHPISGPGGSACGSASNPCPVECIHSGVLAQSSGIGGCDAAGNASEAGDVFPGELDCPTCLNHVVQIIVNSNLNNTALCAEFPAVHTDGTATGSGAFLCEGSKIRYTGDWTALDPATHSTAVLALARALSIYGGAIVDQTGDCSPGSCGFGVYTDYDSAPDMTGDTDLSASLSIYYGGTTLN